MMAAEDATDLSELLSEAPAAHSMRDFDVHVQPAEKASLTAFSVDSWGIRRAKEIAESEINKERGVKIHEPTVICDAHHALFEPEPVLAEKCEFPDRKEWFSRLIETPEYQSLHTQTMLDTFISEIASKAICDQWVQFSKTEETGESSGKPKSEIEKEIDMIRSVSRAIKESSETVESAKDMEAGLGAGGDGSLDRNKMRALFIKNRNNAKLQMIFELAGRYRRLARGLQSRKTTHGTDEITGIETSGNLKRVLPIELGKFCVPELEIEQLRKFSEKRLLSRRFQGVQKVARGPIVIVVDRSGSMASDDKIEHAKALALTLGWVARHQKRWCAFVGFAGGSEGTRLCFPPGKWDEEKLIKWVMEPASGGTDLDVPIKQLPEVYWKEFNCPRGVSDIIFVTDAIVKCPKKMGDNFLAWKKENQVKSYGIILNNSAGDMEKLCDRHWLVSDLSLEQDAISSVLSI